MKNKTQKYLVRGYDAYGNPVEESIEYAPPSLSAKIKLKLAWIVGYKWAYRLGLSKFRPISKIEVRR